MKPSLLLNVLLAASIHGLHLSFTRHLSASHEVDRSAESLPSEGPLQVRRGFPFSEWDTFTKDCTKTIMTHSLAISTSPGAMILSPANGVREISSMLLTGSITLGSPTDSSSRFSTSTKGIPSGSNLADKFVSISSPVMSFLSSNSDSATTRFITFTETKTWTATPSSYSRSDAVCIIKSSESFKCRSEATTSAAFRAISTQVVATNSGSSESHADGTSNISHTLPSMDSARSANLTDRSIDSIIFSENKTGSLLAHSTTVAKPAGGVVRTLGSQTSVVTPASNTMLLHNAASSFNIFSSTTNSLSTITENGATGTIETDVITPSISVLALSSSTVISIAKVVIPQTTSTFFTVIISTSTAPAETHISSTKPEEEHSVATYIGIVTVNAPTSFVFMISTSTAPSPRSPKVTASSSSKPPSSPQTTLAPVYKSSSQLPTAAHASMSPSSSSGTRVSDKPSNIRYTPGVTMQSTPGSASGAVALSIIPVGTKTQTLVPSRYNYNNAGESAKARFSSTTTSIITNLESFGITSITISEANTASLPSGSMKIVTSVVNEPVNKPTSFTENPVMPWMQSPSLFSSLKASPASVLDELPTAAVPEIPSQLPSTTARSTPYTSSDASRVAYEVQLILVFVFCMSALMALF